MSVILIPTGLHVHTFGFGQNDYSLNFSAGDTGSGQTRLLAPPRWTCTMSTNMSLPPEESAKWRSMILQLRGAVNQLAVYDIKYQKPRGTMTGTPSLTSATTVGATSINITTAAFATLLQGDRFQVGSGATRQLLEVVTTATATAGGLMTVVVEPPCRYVQILGSQVILTQPTCLMCRTDTTASWSSSAYADGNFSVSFIERWET